MSFKVRPFRGKWELDLHYRDARGKRRRIRRVAPTRSRCGAARWAQDTVQKILRAEGLPAPSSVPTLTEFASRFLDEYCRAERQKASGIRRKEIALRRHLLPTLGRRRLDEITTEDVARVKLRLRDQAPSSVNNVLTVLAKLLRVAVEWEVLDRLPCTIRLLRRPQTEAAFWDFHELDLLEDAARKLDPTAHVLVVLGALAGLRMGEAIALRWIDVDLPRGRITVRQNDWRGVVDTPKGGRAGTVDLCQRLADALAAHQARSRLRSEDGRVLCRPDGSPLTERIVRRYIEQAERLANLPYRGVHCLRHTFGAHLAMRGASPKAIQELMRHADLSMTQRYTHLSPAARESAVRLLDHVATGSPKAVSSSSTR